MIYYVKDKPIDIPTHRRCFDHGSEGKVYKIENKIYKLYYKSWLHSMGKTLESRHKRLLTIPTEQTILPIDLIYNSFDEYAGYVASFVEKSPKTNTGITWMSSEKLINNLNILRSDFRILSENYILARDVNFDNYVYNQKTDKMYVIDPGRFVHKINLEKEDYIHKNQENLDELLKELLYLDFIKYKPLDTLFPRRMAKNILQVIEERRGQNTYCDFLEQELSGYKNMDEYVSKKLVKKIKN